MTFTFYCFIMVNMLDLESFANMLPYLDSVELGLTAGNVIFLSKVKNSLSDLSIATSSQCIYLRRRYEFLVTTLPVCGRKMVSRREFSFFGPSPLTPLGGGGGEVKVPPFSAKKKSVKDWRKTVYFVR